ncbi:MAG: TIGR00730 family Rossman fold protein [Alphaproteobacteria bacterium]
MAMPKAVCVYCGSSAGADPRFKAAAETLGRQCAESGIDLVYGGGKLGLMGATADAALKAGGRVTGIIPDFLKAVEVQFEDVTELLVTQSMHERKQLMFERSDAFIALPGGIGTLEETIEMLTWAQLGRHGKPIVLVNIAEYWTPLLTLLDHMVAQAFVGESARDLWTAVDDVEAVLPAVEARCGEARQSERDAVFQQRF